ncbi:MAG: hypothetical protein ABFD96_06025 [Armatimonadia bacterium]
MPVPAFNVGDRVTVLPPFDQFYPGVWEITGINPDTGALQIADGVDFDASYLAPAEEE